MQLLLELLIIQKIITRQNVPHFYKCWVLKGVIFLNIKTNFKLAFPKTTLIGTGALEKLGYELKSRKVLKCLIVTDKYITESGVSYKIAEILEKNNIQSHIFSEVTPDPTISQVKRGLSEFVKSGCDSIVSIGGGSPHDCAKAIKYTALEGKFSDKAEIVLAAVNTTAGTASEVTRFAIIKDEERHYKLSLIDEGIIPDIAVDDPLLMINMPPKLTAATGMDALTHALEAYVAKDRNHFTDCTALKSIELINEYLIRAYCEGSDIEAREGMAYAQYLAGLAFSNAGLGLVHAMAHQLGGLYGLPHGLCNAVLLPYVISTNLRAVSKAYAEIARSLGLCEAYTPDKTASRSLVHHIRNMNKRLQIPSTTKELGVKYEDAPRLAKMAMDDPSLKLNPMEVNESEVVKLFQEAYKGII